MVATGRSVYGQGQAWLLIVTVPGLGWGPVKGMLFGHKQALAAGSPLRPLNLSPAGTGRRPVASRLGGWTTLCTLWAPPSSTSAPSTVR